MALKFHTTRRAGPDVFVGDDVAVFGCDMDVTVGEGGGAFAGPDVGRENQAARK